MADETRRWRRIRQEGADWEVRITSSEQQADAHQPGAQEVLEFVCLDGSRRARRLAVSPGAVTDMDESALSRAFRQARPIGGDHYGRPGKHMDDAR